jgi:hypothetical protein
LLTKEQILCNTVIYKQKELTMQITMTLNDNDLQNMPKDLRDQLLQWHFSRNCSSPDSPANFKLASPVSTVGTIVPLRQDGGRISFPALLREGLLASGQDILCRTLKRQQRAGTDAFIEAGKVVPSGMVEYDGHRYAVPSRLALVVLNANGGGARAVNGYDYIFVKSPEGLMSLKKLREKLPKLELSFSEEEAEELGLK